MSGDNSDAAIGPPQSWLVVNTQPHKEQFAIENLERQAFEAYCPVVRKQVRHARRTREVMRPMFPGYVFVAYRPHGLHWRPIASTFGVRKIVGAGDTPGVVADTFIAALKAREIDGAIVLPGKAYAKGQNVEMLGGAFEGLIATILELDEKGRITVLLKLLNQSVKVRTDVLSIREA